MLETLIKLPNCNRNFKTNGIFKNPNKQIDSKNLRTKYYPPFVLPPTEAANAIGISFRNKREVTKYVNINQVTKKHDVPAYSICQLRKTQ